MNIAVPVEHADKKTSLDAFQKALKVGWMMAAGFGEQPGPRDLKDLLAFCEDAQPLALGRPLDCVVTPEVAAEVASFYVL